MNTRESLLRSPSAALGNYFEQALEVAFTPLSCLAPKDSPMRLLTPVELATVRVVAPAASSIITDRYGVAIEAAIRIAIWRDRGTRLSGWAMADALEQFFSPSWRRSRQPWRGWEILRGVDSTSEHHGVEIFLDAEPLPGEPTRHRTMRLVDRLTELSRGGPSPAIRT